MYNKILVPLDGSKLAECVLPHVEDIAKGCSAEAVVLIRVVETLYMPITAGEGYSLSTRDLQRIEEEAKTDAARYLNDLIGRLKYGKVSIKTEVIVGKPAEI